MCIYIYICVCMCIYIYIYTCTHMIHIFRVSLHETAARLRYEEYNLMVCVIGVTHAVQNK